MKDLLLSACQAASSEHTRVRLHSQKAFALVAKEPGVQLLEEPYLSESCLMIRHEAYIERDGVKLECWFARVATEQEERAFLARRAASVRTGAVAP